MSHISQAAVANLTTVATYDAAGGSTVHTNSSGNLLSSVALNDVAGFTTAVAAAHTAGNGGVIDFAASSTNTNAELKVTYATVKKFDISSTIGGATGVSQSIDIRNNPDSLSPTSGTALLMPTSGNSPRPTSWTLSFGQITGGLIGEVITTAGFTLVSRDGFSSDVIVNWFIDGSSTPQFIDPENIASGKGVDNTFFSYTAPTGSAITGFQIVFDPSASTADRRLGIDDIGFITGVIPEPGAALLSGIAAAFGVLRRRR
jgi:hypothetical protein